MIRLALAVLTAAVGTVVFAPVGILAWPFRRDGEVGFFVTRLWARAILATAGVRTVVEVREPLPEGPVVFVCNHVSALDIPVLFAALPHSFRIVYKSSLMYVPLMGQLLVAARNVPIDRSRAFSATRSLARAARRIAGGVSVALFPEGTRSRMAPMGTFKRGSFKLAVEAGAPVVPVSLIGMRGIIANGGITPGTVRLRIHAALRPEAGVEPVASLTSRAEAIIRDETEGT